MPTQLPPVLTRAPMVEARTLQVSRLWLGWFESSYLRQGGQEAPSNTELESDLATTNDALDQTQADLAQTQAELDQTQADLAGTQASVSGLEEELAAKLPDGAPLSVARYQADGSGVEASPQVVVDASGSLGIGTATPPSRLTVHNGTLTVQRDDGVVTQLTLNSTSVVERRIQWQTNGVARWHMAVSSEAESGSHQGSNWSLLRRADDGTALSTVLRCERATGNVQQGTFASDPASRNLWILGSGTGPGAGVTFANAIAQWAADRGGVANKMALHLQVEDGTKHVLGDRVGLGTLTPAHALDVVGAINASDAPTTRTNLGLGALAVLNTVGTAQIDDQAVTYAKIQNVTDERLLGRSAGIGGPPQEITVGSGLVLSQGVLVASETHQGFWRWSTTTSGTPLSGQIFVNNANYLAATLVTLSETTDGGTDASNILALLQPGDTLSFQDRDNSARSARYRIDAVPTDLGTYRTIAVTGEAWEGAPLTNNQVVLVRFTMAGKSSQVVNTFLDLSDTPDTYSGQGANLVTVNAGATGLDFTPLTAAGRALLDDADAAAQRTTLGLGTADPVQHGRLGLGVASSANAPLAFPTTLGQKILLSESGTTRYGVGLGSTTTQLFAASTGQVQLGALSTTDGSTFTAHLSVAGASGNVGLGVATWGTSAARVLAIGSGTAPSAAHPADAVQIWVEDLDGLAGAAALHVRSENGALTRIGTGIIGRTVVTVLSSGATVTTPYLLVADEAGKTLIPNVAGEMNQCTLPSAAAGLVYTFIVQQAVGLRVRASAGDNIRLGSVVGSTAGALESTTIGNYLTLLAYNATTWQVMVPTQQWTPIA